MGCLTLWRYHEFYVEVYLSKLHPSISTQIHGSALFGNCILDLPTIFLVALEVIISTPLSSQTSLFLGRMSTQCTTKVGIPRTWDDIHPLELIVDALTHGKGHNSFPLLGFEVDKISKTLMQILYAMETYQIEHSTLRNTEGR